MISLQVVTLFLVFCAVNAGDPNVAVHKPRASSARWSWDWRADKGNDGVTGGWNLFHTAWGTNNWWCVDLGRVHTLSHIRIYNRNDHVQWRLKGFEIKMCDTCGCSGSGRYKARMCHIDSSGSHGQYDIKMCNQGGRMYGRYMYVVLPKTEYLHFREFQAFGKPDYCYGIYCQNGGMCSNGNCICKRNYIGNRCQIYQCAGINCLHGGTCDLGKCKCKIGFIGNRCEKVNIAYSKGYALSSVYSYSNYPNHRGNNGLKDGIIHTKKDPIAWWCVNLEKVYEIETIEITNRKDVQYRLKGFEVRLGDITGCNIEGVKKARVCHKDTTTKVQTEYAITSCNRGSRSMSGQFVYLLITNEYLHVQEVAVTSKNPKSIYTLPSISLNMGTKQSSDLSSSYPSKNAVDNSANTFSKTKSESNAWICVDLESNYPLELITFSGANTNVFEVKLDQRDYCTSEGFKQATSCYKQDKGFKAVTGCNQGTAVFAARSVYITVSNKAIELPDVKVFPLMDVTCTRRG